jgi:glycosyltransferase involved in cell wall biosynthesis
MDSDNVTVSVVSVVLNSRELLGKSISSIISQKYTDFEYIVIDGGSTDGTVDVIKKNTQYIHYWLSEPDNGIFDAMNKGIEKARGDWICFLNAGDTFYDQRTLQEIFKDKYDADLIYGDCIYDYGNFKVYSEAGSVNSLWKGMVFSHQSVFVRAGLMKSNKFDLNFITGADYDFIYSLYKRGGRFLYITVPFVVNDAFGISNRKLMQSIKEHYKIFIKYSTPTIKQRILYRKQFFLINMINFLRNVLPQKYYFRILKLYHKDRLVRD